MLQRGASIDGMRDSLNYLVVMQCQLFVPIRTAVKSSSPRLGELFVLIRTAVKSSSPRLGARF